jgi:hypothetical protein
MTRVTNTGEEFRTWISLVNTETGTTLALGPGESAETDIAEGFDDPYLKADGDLGDYVAPEITEEDAPAEEAPATSTPGGGVAFPTVTTDVSATDA